MTTNTGNQCRFAKCLGRITPLEWLLIGLQVALVLATRLGQPIVDIDDAYTHFRIARNFADGNGFVFNVGQRVLGTTSPVWVAILAAFYKLSGIPIHLLACWLNTLIEIVVILAVVFWFKRAGMPLLMRHAAGAILTIEPLGMTYGLAGMEMSLLIALTIAIFELAGRGRWVIAGLLLGLIGWVRPEGAILWVATPVGMWFGPRRRDIPRLLGVAVALAAVIAAGLAAYFGTFVPQSVVAKSSAHWYRQFGFCWQIFLVRLGDLTPFYAFHGTVCSWGGTVDKINSLIMAFAQIILMALGASWLWRAGQRQITASWVLFVLGWFLFYALSNPAIVDWYYVPYFFGALMLAVAGWHALGVAAWQRFASRLRPFAKFVYPLTILLLVSVYWLSSAHQMYRAGRPSDSPVKRLTFRFEREISGAREPKYKAMGLVLRESFQGRALPMVACTEIGVFGYYYGGPMLDLYGLVSPEALRAQEQDVLSKVPPDWRRFPYAAIMFYRPEFIMSDQMFLPNPPRDFDAFYKLVPIKTVAMPLWVRRDAIGKLSIPTKYLGEKIDPNS